MTTVHAEPLVEDYLRRLDAASQALPHARRAELVGEIRAHIEEALGARDADEAAVRNVLERLGTPEEIVAAETDGLAEPAAPGGRETLALVVLGLGGVLLPVVGWLTGLILVLLSRAWTAREKLLAALVPPVITLGAGILLAVAAAAPAGDPSPDSGLGPVELLTLLLALGSGPLAAAYLAWRLRGGPGRSRW
jgi:hypothetical protein